MLIKIISLCTNLSHHDQDEPMNCVIVTMKIVMWLPLSLLVSSQKSLGKLPSTWKICYSSYRPCVYLWNQSDFVVMHNNYYGHTTVLLLPCTFCAEP